MPASALLHSVAMGTGEWEHRESMARQALRIEEEAEALLVESSQSVDPSVTFITVKLSLRSP